jgi:glycosyltransferase involved in cell wall biosynthesis
MCSVAHEAWHERQVAVTAVTAAIVAYNAERYYAEAIESLLDQTHRDLELLLVVDRASTDRTLEIAKGYEARDPRVRVIEVDHCNIPTKFARVVTEAKGDWIAFLDADDVALPHRIERCLAAAQRRPEVVAWFGWSWQIRPDGTRFRMVRRGPTDKQRFDALRRDHDIPIFDHGTGLFRRDALIAAGNYDPMLTIIPDFDIVDRVSDVGLMLTIPEPLMEYRLHGANNSVQNFDLQSRQVAYLWQRRAAKDRGAPFPSFDEFVRHPPSQSLVRRWSFATRERSRFYWNATGVDIACGRWGQAVLAATRSILWNPRSVAHRMWRSYLRPRLRQSRRLAILVTHRRTAVVFHEDEHS